MESETDIKTEMEKGTAPGKRKISRCSRCGVPITHDEEAITRKLINRGTHTFYCKKCLSEFYEISIDILDSLIERYKKQGCTLFSDTDR